MGETAIGTTGKQIYRDQELAYGLGNTPLVANVGGLKFYPTSLPVAIGGDKKEYKDNTGTTCSMVIPETFQTISISGYLIKNGADAAASITKGDEVANLPVVEGMKTGSDVHWRVEEMTINWQNEDVASVSLSVKSYTF